jgi:mitogen-activated protein kinase organizer 1
MLPGPSREQFYSTRSFICDSVTEKASVLDVGFDSTGRFGLSAMGRVMRLWNIETGMLIQTYADHGHEVTSVGTSADGDRLASCAGRTAFVWDVATSQRTARYARHDGVLNAIQFGGQSDALLLTASYDKCVRMFDLRSRASSPVQVLRGAKDSISDLAVPLRKAQIVVCSIDGTVRVYDVRQGELSVDDLCAPVSSICVSHDGECVLASCLDECLRLLDVSTGELLATYEGHKNASYKLGCSILHDDSLVVSGSEDGRLCLWNLVDSGSAPVVGKTCSQSVVCAVAAHPSHRVVLTGSHDGTLLAWRLATDLLFPTPNRVDET